MNATHGLAVTDAAVGFGVVGGIIDVDEGQPRRAGMEAPVTALQQPHLPQAQRTTAVVKQCE